MNVIFEFTGGPRDGDCLYGDTADCDIAEFDIPPAVGYYWETGYGQVGNGVHVWPPFSDGTQWMKRQRLRAVREDESTEVFSDEEYYPSPFPKTTGVQPLPEDTADFMHRYAVSEVLRDDTTIYIISKYVGAVAADDVPGEDKCPWYERLVQLGIKEVLQVHKDFPLS